MAIWRIRRLSSRPALPKFKAEDYLAEASIRVEDAILAMRRENGFDDDGVIDIASQAARGLAGHVQRRPLVGACVAR